MTLLPISFTAAAATRLTAARYEDVGAFAHKLLSRGKADAAVATSYECNFSFKFVHIFPHFFTVYDGRRPAERVAHNQVTQSISRFGQREGLARIGLIATD